MSAQLSLVEQYNDITSIIKDRQFGAVSDLPPVWQSLARMRGTTNLSDQARADYVEAAQLFGKNSKMAKVMDELGHDFDRDRYPDLAALKAVATSTLAIEGLDAIEALFKTFGYDVPASFYQLLVHLVAKEEDGKFTKLFRDHATMDRDCLWDATIHSMLLNPLGLYMQSVFSQHGLRFQHLVMCSCALITCKDQPFTITIEPTLLPAYLQNFIVGIFKQYEG